MPLDAAPRRPRILRRRADSGFGIRYSEFGTRCSVFGTRGRVALLPGLFLYPDPAHTVSATDRDIPLLVARLTAVFGSVVAAVYAVAEVTPAPAVEFFLAAVPTFAVVLWLQRDAARTGVGAVLDFGYFLLLAWPIVIPWYAFKTRGWKGRWLTIRLFVLILAPWLTGYLVGELWWWWRYAEAGGPNP